MSRKLIGRMAAGACSICICYGLAVQVLQGKPVEQSVNTAVVQEQLTSEEERPSTPSEGTGETPSTEEQKEPEYYYDVPHRHRHGHGRHGHHEGWTEDGQYPSDAAEQEPSGTAEQKPSDTEESEDKKKTEKKEKDSSGSQQKTAGSGDPPTLSQFLSALRCGGCGHNCSLLNPRCMRGRSKAEAAQAEYAQTYGSDSK